MKNFRLYELTGAYIDMLELAEDNESSPEIQVAFIEQYDQLEKDRKQKIKNCCAYYKNLKGRSEIIENHIKELTKKLDSLKAAEERFREYIQRNMLTGESYDDGLHKISWRHSERIDVEREDLIPVQYLREKISYEPDKIRMKEDIKCGAEIPGVKLIKDVKMQIK